MDNFVGTVDTYLDLSLQLTWKFDILDYILDLSGIWLVSVLGLFARASETEK